MKKIIILVIVILVIVLGIVIGKNVVIKPEEECIAVIYHSEMFGIDAGTEYIYYIYPNGEKKYEYIKTKAYITIAGAGEEEYIKSGKINKKEEFEKIKKLINMDKVKSVQRNITYTYINDGTKQKCSSIEELIEKLF